MKRWQLHRFHLGLVRVTTDAQGPGGIAAAATQLLSDFACAGAGMRQVLTVAAVTTDAATNLVKAVREGMLYPHTVCAAQQLHRCFAALEAVPFFAAVTRKALLISNRIHGDGTGRAAVRRYERRAMPAQLVVKRFV